MSHDVLIVGAGLAGLCCARQLQSQGIDSLILEASDGVGGRIRTDRVEGFQLDRGFQVFLTSYPEARAVLDFDALKLQPFWSGALVRHQGRFHELADPWRRPLAACRSLLSPIGSFADFWRVATFRAKTLRGVPDNLFRAHEQTALEELQQAGFSSAMIERFFRPFLGGIFLEAELRTSSRLLNFLFRMFSTGQATLPAEGMEAIPRQVASHLRPGSIRTGARVLRVSPTSVTLTGGEVLEAKAIVVATDEPTAATLLGDPIRGSAGQGTTCLYFVAPHAPISQPLLVLNGEGRGPIHNLCVPTQVAPTYGTGDRALVSVTVLGANHPLESIKQEVLGQLREWFGPAVNEWRLLRTYVIPYALPNQTVPALEPPERPVRLPSGVYVCGDHRDHGSIQGAMVSGRRAATAILQDRV